MDDKANRSFLFLQGPISSFFKELGNLLLEEGHSLLRVNLHGGDQFFWNDKNSIPYNGKFDDWVETLNELHEKHHFTDLIVYNDCRPYHKTAIKLFKKHNVKIHVFEEGYLRPYWITYEENGVNAYSNLPNYREFYDKLDFDKEDYTYEDNKVFKGSFLKRFIYTYIYYLYRGFFEAYNFKNYISHRVPLPQNEARRWLKRILTVKFKNSKALIEQKNIIRKKKPFYLLALQLCSDTQISEHSDFKNMSEVLELVIKNFSRNSSKDQYLVVKTHPEDNGLTKIFKNTIKIAQNYNVSDRVIFVDGGKMPCFLRNMRGMITINSTAGISALHHLKPVKCLGRAFYNFEGLTDQNDLSNFWLDPKAPDQDLFLRFKKYVMVKSQINGGYYTKESIKITLNNLREKI